MSDNQRAYVKATALITAIRSALASGTVHRSMDGSLLTTEMEVLAALCKDGQVVLERAEETP